MKLDKIKEYFQLKNYCVYLFTKNGESRINRASSEIYQIERSCYNYMDKCNRLKNFLTSFDNIGFEHFSDIDNRFINIRDIEYNIQTLISDLRYIVRKMDECVFVTSKKIEKYKNEVVGFYIRLDIISRDLDILNDQATKRLTMKPRGQRISSIDPYGEEIWED